jgi:dTDP-4-amino-4,6-dideoxygalactose transaminase
MIGFNKPYFTGKETEYILEAVKNVKISGNGIFTKSCHKFFETKFGFKKALLTTSCTDALEMAAILIDCKAGDEIILPSYTFVSTANAFVLRGAKLIFADSSPINPNIDPDKIEELITPKTKAIVVVHYAGISCDMGKILDIAKRHNLYTIEDAAQAIDSYYNGQPLGSLADLSAFSFHETKNIISGEGGMLVINNEKFLKRAEIIWEKGTDRSAFFRGEVDKYTWKDIGSSFLPSEIIAACLFAQLECLEDIQERRRNIWTYYNSRLLKLNQYGVKLPEIPAYATNNAHMYYLVCRDLSERDKLITYLKGQEIQAIFHYLSLHKSDFYREIHGDRKLPQTDFYSDCLVRLPFYYEITTREQDLIIEHLLNFFTMN